MMCMPLKTTKSKQGANQSNTLSVIVAQIDWLVLHEKLTLRV